MKLSTRKLFWLSANVYLDTDRYLFLKIISVGINNVYLHRVSFRKQETIERKSIDNVFIFIRRVRINT